MAETKTVAERLREAEGLCEIYGMCRILLQAIIGKETCPPTESCEDCKKGILRTLARQIEAEQTELDKRIEVLESDRDDYIEHVTTFACWQMQIANMLDIPLAERNDSGEVQAKIIAALKERTKTEQNGVDVDALLKLADEISVLVDVPPYKAHSVPASIARMWKHDIRNAVKNAKPQLPEGIEWPRFEDGQPVKIGDKLGREIGSIEFYGDFVTMRAKDGTNIQTDIYGTRYERPEPEVLDADGVPIKVGDTVWHEDEGECVVERIYRQNGDTLLELDVCGAIWSTANVKPAEVTHRKPDTQEAIDADCWVDAKDYCEKYGVKTEWPKHYGKAKCEHLLERQRKLLGGE